MAPSQNGGKIPLTDLQSSRVDFARRDLESARAADLTHLNEAGLILVVERLRTRLDDILGLVDEVATCDTSNSTTVGGTAHPRD
ncbi:MULTISPECIES: hypothetical protein [unclassified Streptomyces]|uniref:hypothetical protein n=1 Tax=unclassified Streptomyces TaxID=2593676 RepID=UPI003BB4B8A6